MWTKHPHSYITTLLPIYKYLFLLEKEKSYFAKENTTNKQEV